MTTLDVQVKRLCENLRSARSALQQALDERDALVADLREMADGWQWLVREMDAPGGRVLDEKAGELLALLDRHEAEKGQAQ